MLTETGPLVLDLSQSLETTHRLDTVLEREVFSAPPLEDLPLLIEDSAAYQNFRHASQGLHRQAAGEMFGEIDTLNRSRPLLAPTGSVSSALQRQLAMQHCLAHGDTQTLTAALPFLVHDEFVSTSRAADLMEMVRGGSGSFNGKLFSKDDSMSFGGSNSFGPLLQGSYGFSLSGGMGSGFHFTISEEEVSRLKASDPVPLQPRARRRRHELGGSTTEKLDATQSPSLQGRPQLQRRHAKLELEEGGNAAMEGTFGSSGSSGGGGSGSSSFLRRIFTKSMSWNSKQKLSSGGGSGAASNSGLDKLNGSVNGSAGSGLSVGQPGRSKWWPPSIRSLSRRNSCGSSSKLMSGKRTASSAELNVPQGDDSKEAHAVKHRKPVVVAVRPMSVMGKPAPPAVKTMPYVPAKGPPAVTASMPPPVNYMPASTPPEERPKAADWGNLRSMINPFNPFVNGASPAQCQPYNLSRSHGMSTMTASTDFTDSFMSTSQPQDSMMSIQFSQLPSYQYSQQQLLHQTSNISVGSQCWDPQPGPPYGAGSPLFQPEYSQRPGAGPRSSSFQRFIAPRRMSSRGPMDFDGSGTSIAGVDECHYFSSGMEPPRGLGTASASVSGFPSNSGSEMSPSHYSTTLHVPQIEDYSVDASGGFAVGVAPAYQSQDLRGKKNAKRSMSSRLTSWLSVKEFDKKKASGEMGQAKSEMVQR